MFSFILATVLLTQTPAPTASSNDIASAFNKALENKALENTILQKTIKGQFTLLAKDGDDVVLLVYNYQTTLGKNPYQYRSEGTLKVGIETQLRPFIVVSDEKSLTVYDKTKNIYSVAPAKQTPSNPSMYSGLITSVLLMAQQKPSGPSSSPIPQINDPEAASEALAIFPKLFAQSGILSVSQTVEPSGRYSLIWDINEKSIPSSGKISLTLNQNKAYIERMRVELQMEEKRTVTLTDVVESITPASPQIKFAFDIPKRAKKVKELPGLLDSVSSQG